MMFHAYFKYGKKRTYDREKQENLNQKTINLSNKMNNMILHLEELVFMLEIFTKKQKINHFNHIIL